MNTTEAAKPAPVKVTHDTSIGRSAWTASTNMTSADDQTITPGEDNGYASPPPSRPSPGSSTASVAYTGTTQATITLTEESLVTVDRDLASQPQTDVTGSATLETGRPVVPRRCVARL